MIPIGDENVVNKGFPFLTVMLILLNIFGFYLQLTAPNLEQFVAQYALVPANVSLAETSTLIPFITMMFLHGSLMHIISNMLFLWIFGDNIEHTYGRIPFLVLYFASGIAAAVAQYLLAPTSTIPILGASGAIAGILGAYLVRFPTNRIRTLIPFFPLFFTIHVPAVVMIGLWFFTQLFNGLGSLGVQSSITEGGVAWWAHIGGFIAGVILAYIIPFKRPQPVFRDMFS